MFRQILDKFFKIMRLVEVVKYLLEQENYKQTVTENNNIT